MKDYIIPEWKDSKLVVKHYNIFFLIIIIIKQYFFNIDDEERTSMTHLAPVPHKENPSLSAEQDFDSCTSVKEA